MRTSLLVLSATVIIRSASAQTVIYSQNFDGFATGNLVAQTCGAPWSTWSAAPGGTEDTPISDDYAYSGSLSMKVSGAAAGGPTDLILGLGDRTQGSYLLSWMMYIPAGFGGYFNVQHYEVVSTGSWMLDVTFNPDGTIDYTIAGAGAGSYPQDEWFSVALGFDMGTANAVVIINGVPQFTFQTTTPGPSQLGGIDFFAFAGGAPDMPTYYVDDVLFMDVTGVGVAEETLPEVNMYPNPTEGLFTIDLAGLSSRTSASVVDITGRTVVGPRTPQQVGRISRATFDLGALPEGLYFARILEGDREIVRRLTKQ